MPKFAQRVLDGGGHLQTLTRPEAKAALGISVTAEFNKLIDDGELWELPNGHGGVVFLSGQVHLLRAAKPTQVPTAEAPTAEAAPDGELRFDDAPTTAPVAKPPSEPFVRRGSGASMAT